MYTYMYIYENIVSAPPAVWEMLPVTFFSVLKFHYRDILHLCLVYFTEIYLFHFKANISEIFHPFLAHQDHIYTQKNYLFWHADFIFFYFDDHVYQIYGFFFQEILEFCHVKIGIIWILSFLFESLLILSLSLTVIAKTSGTIL